jgi:hypothetical protein
MNVVMIGGKPQHYAGLAAADQTVEFADDIKSITDPGKMGVAREKMTDIGLQFTRRKMKDGSIVYLVKNSKKTFDDFVPIGKGENMLLFDPMTGVIGEPERKEQSVRLQLNKGQTIILAESELDAPPFSYTNIKGKPVDLKTAWTITFEDGGPALPPPVKTDKPVSWTTYGEAYEDFSGTAVYTTNFQLPAGAKGDWILDLGDVRESARVVLNGKEIARLISPPFRVKIEPSMAQKVNVLEVHISNLAANRIAWLDRKGIPWKKFYNINFPARKAENRKDGLFDASKWVSRPSGLLGPVQLLYSGSGVER